MRDPCCRGRCEWLFISVALCSILAALRCLELSCLVLRLEGTGNTDTHGHRSPQLGDPAPPCPQAATIPFRRVTVHGSRVLLVSIIPAYSAPESECIGKRTVSEEVLFDARIVRDIASMSAEDPYTTMHEGVRGRELTSHRFGERHGARKEPNSAPDHLGDLPRPRLFRCCLMSLALLHIHICCPLPHRLLKNSPSVDGKEKDIRATIGHMTNAPAIWIRSFSSALGLSALSYPLP